MKLDEKRCPSCAEEIKKAAKVCKHCGHQFSQKEIEASVLAPEQTPASIGCALVIIVALIWFGFSAFGSDNSKEKTASAEDRRNGLHCLSGWDGSSSTFVDSVKSRLRDPGSFEHVETRISPALPDGTHTITMEYRARNGFGGMNVGSAVGALRQSDCSVVSVKP